MAEAAAEEEEDPSMKSMKNTGAGEGAAGGEDVEDEKTPEKDEDDGEGAASSRGFRWHVPCVVRDGFSA